MARKQDMYASTAAGLVVVFYLIAGGLAAVVMPDALKMIVIFIGTSTLLGIGLWKSRQRVEISG